MLATRTMESQKTLEEVVFFFTNKGGHKEQAAVDEDQAAKALSKQEES